MQVLLLLCRISALLQSFNQISRRVVVLPHTLVFSTLWTVNLHVDAVEEALGMKGRNAREVDVRQRCEDQMSGTREVNRRAM